MNFEQLDKIAKDYGTPYYLMDSNLYRKNISSFTNAFLNQYDKLIIGYSFKTNYVPKLCSIAKNLGCYAEVVSEMEYQLAKKLDFKHIIFNGPIKRKQVLEMALEDQAIINLDSFYELDTILSYRKNHPNKEMGVGLRLNIDLTDKDGHSRVQCGLRVGRFGFTQNILQKVIPLLRENQIKIISLHGHTSSSDRAVDNYRLIVQQMLTVCEKYQLNDLLYFDVGGGFFGAAAKGVDISNKPRYEDYANCITEECLSHDWFNTIRPYIIIEPGVSVVANVFSYVSQIYQNKEINGQYFLTTDGTVFDVKPTMHSFNLPHKFYSQKDGEATCLRKANLVGSTCMEKDIILNNIDVPSNITYGDYIQIFGVGAYTIVFTPTFINFKSPILEIDQNNDIHIVRRRQTINDVIAPYEI